jgi:L-fuculose-phosphate aldolase
VGKGGVAERPDAPLREALVAAVHRLDALGLNRGSTGNVSVRAQQAPGGFWITPTGMTPAELTPDALVWVSLDGAAGSRHAAPGGTAPGSRDARGSGAGQDRSRPRIEGAWEPSTEWPFHRAIYARRPDLHAVVHVHSVHATALACLRRDLPAFHYMVAVAGGDSVPCVPYHLFGTEALSRAVEAAFADRQACLMANHGLVAGGTTLAHALKVTLEVEALCEAYLKALAAGEPVLLTADQMAAVLARFRTYGQVRRGGDRTR